jgi:putative CocE/NonD family hydrolase
MRACVCLLLVSLIGPARAADQPLAFPKAAATDAAELDKAMPALAREAIANYREADREKYLDTLFRLQLTAGQDKEAAATLASLRDLLKGHGSAYARAARHPYELYAAARLREADRRVPFAEAFGQAFRDAYAALDDRDAYYASRTLAYELRWARMELDEALAARKDKDGAALPDALALVRAYLQHQVYKEILPLVEPLAAEDDGRRYLITDELIKAPGGVSLSAFVVRKRGADAPRPAALVHTIYAHPAREIGTQKLAAALGYVGVVSFTRGKLRSPGPAVPYEQEAADTHAVIDWVSKQPWCDGRVAMYGGSYNGFTQWAAAKTLHPALKAIVPYAANNPGDGLPMENNVFLLPNYAWAFYVTNNKYVDDSAYADLRRRSLSERWFASGKPYRQVDQIDGTPNPWLQRWLQHPSYDSYWQGLVPYKEEFARVNIPVLTITGYYDDGQQSALHYLKEHYRHNPRAEHYLLVGPYDHVGCQQSYKQPVLRGYAIDPVAQIDTPEVTFQWLDHVLRGGKRPDLIKDRVNYEVMGANEWRHAPSLAKMSNETLTLYLTDRKAGDRYALSPDKPAAPGALHQDVDFADRKTSNNDYYPFPVVGKTPNLSNGYCFVSEPFEEPVTVSGTFAGEIKARINKKDMDVGVVLYEVLPDGRLLHLSYIVGRASHARDMSARQLLTPGRVEALPFEKTRLVCRRLARGSRLMVTLNVNKNRNAQVNYGTGKDVSDEDISDAKEPLRIDWQNDSYVKIPLWRGD